MSPVPFTLAAYASICRALAASGQRTLTVAEYFTARPAAGFVILRCDVDDRPLHALQLARVLTAHDLRATFYWHAAPPALYRPDLMAQIAALGHEIGYHHTAWSRCGGDADRAAALFQADVAQFRAAGFDVRTAAAHGTPGYDNRDLIRARPDLLAACRLVGEAFLDVDFGRVQYVSDAGWGWRRFPLRPDAHQVRAQVGVAKLPALRDADVIGLIRAPGAALYLNTHPELWFASPFEARWYRARRRAGERLLQGPLRRWLTRLKGRQGL